MDSIIEKIREDFFEDFTPLCPEETERMGEVRERFFQTLTNEQKLLFEEFEEAREEFYSAYEEKAFSHAFKSAFRFALELLGKYPTVL